MCTCPGGWVVCIFSDVVGAEGTHAGGRLALGQLGWLYNRIWDGGGDARRRVCGWDARALAPELTRPFFR